MSLYASMPSTHTQTYMLFVHSCLFTYLIDTDIKCVCMCVYIYMYIYIYLKGKKNLWEAGQI